MPGQPEPARLSARCAGCGRGIAPAAAFCTACGRATPAGLRAVGDRSQRERERARRSVLALALVVAGVLVLLLAAARLEVAPFPQQLALEGGLFAVGLAAVALQGGDAWRASLAGPASGRAAALGVALGALTFAISFAWVLLLQRTFAGVAAPQEGLGVPLVLVLALGVVLTPLVEEWLCRGILWQALERHAPRAATLALSALLFALLHGLGSLGWLELPHRFVSGLLLGLLRARSGSLGPCVIAHGTHNLLAVLLRG